MPTDERMRVVWGGDDPKGNQHALMPDQRWAYDLVVEPTDLTSDAMEAWSCFGVHRETVRGAPSVARQIAHRGQIALLGPRRKAVPALSGFPVMGSRVRSARPWPCP